MKNVCQTCLLDLEYGLPVQVRDHALGIKDDIPKGDVSKEYMIQNAEKEVREMYMYFNTCNCMYVCMYVYS